MKIAIGVNVCGGVIGRNTGQEDGGGGRWKVHDLVGVIKARWRGLPNAATHLQQLLTGVSERSPSVYGSSPAPRS